MSTIPHIKMRFTAMEIVRDGVIGIADSLTVRARGPVRGTNQTLGGLKFAPSVIWAPLWSPNRRIDAAFDLLQSDTWTISTLERRSLAKARPNQKKSTNPRTARKAPSCQRLRPGPVGLSALRWAVHKTAAAKRKQRTPAARAGESPDQRIERTSTIANRKANRPSVVADR